MCFDAVLYSGSDASRSGSDLAHLHMLESGDGHDAGAAAQPNQRHTRRRRRQGKIGMHLRPVILYDVEKEDSGVYLMKADAVVE